METNQLESWTNRGAIQSSINSHEAIRSALSSSTGLSNSNYEVYLQGSYKNSTNIRGNSDVDVVVQLNSCFYSNLSDSEKSQLGLIPASYGLSDFRHNVMDALVNRFGSANVVQGNKSVKIQFNSTGVVPADVVVCIEYRHYSALRVLYTGMGFLTNAGQELIINYPKLHYENGTKKSDRTSGAYKKTVRMFKNANRYFRERYQARTVPSYLIECSLYNIKDSLFSFQLRDRFYKIASLLAEDDVSNFVSQNGIGTLWGNRPDQFEASLLRKFACNMQKL